MFPILMLIACQQHKSQTIENTTSTDTPSTSVEEKKPLPSMQEVKDNNKILTTSGLLQSLQDEYSVGVPIEINYLRQYPNGCFEQQEVVHSRKENNLTHEFTVIDHSSEGNYCTMAIIPGGFIHNLECLNAGTYTGQIIMNGELQLEYYFTVTDQGKEQ